ncbi:MAG: hypothetical protein QOJ29_4621 [Thermoleophilaceae bacterium]|jgi:hypothetical protein|nr:hypothetical protein [Thermoleophilaceae bacterium]
MDDARGAKGAAILLLGGVAITHLADLPHKLMEARYMAVLFIFLIVASLVLSLLISSNWRPELVWPATGLICGLTVVGYVVSRVVPLPGMADHVGDWLNVAGILALACELELISIAVERFQAVRPAPLVRQYVSRARASSPSKRFEASA